MTIVSKRTFGFTSASVYRRREPHAFKYLSERATFWIAVLSVFAFVTGNMIGQHGWHVFWKSVMGEGSENTIVFTGMVPPVAQIPDYERWGRLGGNPRTDMFRQVPRDLLVPLPPYIHHGNDLTSDQALRRVYFVEHLGTYATGRGMGSHTGVDISLPQGTPIQSVANGVVVKSANDPGGFGNYIMIKHPNIPDVDSAGTKSAIYSIYAHLQESLVQEGMVVQKGEQIALSGKTGNATAPHLHFQMERDSAPYHPFWPFNSADQRNAGMSFVQAIDAGLGRSQGVQYALDPMLTVQSYLSYTPGTAVAQRSSSSVRSRISSIADRRAQRLARMSSQPTTLVAFHDAAPVAPPPVPSSAPAAPSSELSTSVSAPAPAAPAQAAVAGVRLSHSGSFSRDRGWQTLTLFLLDADGSVIQTPVSGTEKLYLTTAFGKAEFKPASVTLSDFRNGMLRVQMLPLGEQTVLVQVQPLGSMSTPMRFVR